MTNEILAVGTRARLNLKRDVDDTGLAAGFVDVWESYPGAGDCPDDPSELNGTELTITRYRPADEEIPEDLYEVEFDNGVRMQLRRDEVSGLTITG